MRMLLTIAITCVCVSASATTYHVDPSGADTNPGTEGQPWETITKAAETMVAGDMTVVHPGVYPERITTQADGTESAPITYTADGSVQMNGFILRHKYTTIQGFEVTGAVTTGYKGGVEIYPLAAYCNVVSNDIHHLGEGLSCIRFQKSGNDPSEAAQHCVIRGNQLRASRNAIVIMYGDGHLLEDNLLEDSYGFDAIRLFGRNHVIRNNLIKNINHFPGQGDHTDIFQTFGVSGDVSYDMLIEGNVIKDCLDTAICQIVQQGQDIRDWTWRNNIFINVDGGASLSIPGLRWYNNTFVNCNRRSGHVLSFAYSANGAAHDSEVINNVFFGCGVDPLSSSKGWYTTTAGVTNFVADYNFVASSDYTPKRTSDVRSAFDFVEDHGINGGNPLFVSEAGYDVRLKSNSPLIDAGTALSGFTNDRDGVQRPAGTNWDIGACEGHDFTTGQNSAPQVNAGADKEIALTEGVTVLDGTVSDDGLPEASILTVRWSVVSGPGAVTFLDDSSPATSASFSTAGVYQLALMASDSALTNVDYLTATVTQAEGTAKKLLFLRLDGDLSDSSGSGNVAQWVGTSAYSVGPSGMAADFADAGSGEIVVNHRDTLDGLAEITIACWARKEQSTAEGYLVHKHAVYNLEIAGAGAYFRAKLYNDSDPSESASASVAIPSQADDTEWHHYAMTYDGAAIRLYFDGTLQPASETSFAGRLARQESRNIVLGRSPWTPVIDGAIDEVCVFDMALDKVAVADLAKARRPNPLRNLRTTISP